MKKYLAFLFIVFSFPASISAQQLVVNTTRFVGGDASCGYSETRYAIPTTDGGVLFVGLTTCYSGGGDIPANFPDTIGAEPQGNVLIGKLDSNMNLSWVKVYGGNRDDLATGAVQTSDGGYAVLAFTGSNDIDVSGNHGSEDLWLIRLDASGNLLWQKCYGSAYDEQSGAIALTPDGGFIFYGVSNGAGGDVPTHYSGSQFDYDWVVIKTDSAGNKQWAKSIGGTNDENIYGSILVVDTCYYLVSSSASTDHDCTDTVWHAGVHTESDYYVFKLDASGNILWDSSYGGGNGDVAYNAKWDARDSSVVINGITTANGYMVSGFHGQEDMWVIKISKNGVLKWQACMGGPENDEGSSISLSKDGYVAYGSTSPGTIGLEDAWVFSLAMNGGSLTDKKFGGTGDQWMSSIVPFKQGFAATGYTNSLSFTEGLNIGHFPGLAGETFVTYIDYWPLGIQNANPSAIQNVTLYPNPTNGIVRLILPEGNGNFSVTNYIGEIVQSSMRKTSELNIDVNAANWANGLYIVKWQGEDGTVLINKFIKN
jgi:type IX secretion system substrate protein